MPFHSATFKCIKGWDECFLFYIIDCWECLPEFWLLLQLQSADKSEYSS